MRFLIHVIVYSQLIANVVVYSFLAYFFVSKTALADFHLAHPTEWAESISGIGLTMFVRPSSLRR